MALWRLNRLRAANRAARRAAALDPGFASAWINIAALHKRGDRDGEALTAYRRAELVDGSDPTVPLNQAVIALRSGDFERGWRLYRSRHKAQGVDTAAMWPGLPEWRGHRLPGRLRIVAEQGIGDAIMFLTLLHAVRPLVGAVTLLVSARLVPLIRRSLPDIDVAAPDPQGRLPALPPAEAWICAGDLPAALGLFTGGDCRPRPFLRPDPRLTARLRKTIARRATGRRLVGITWTSRAEDGWRRTIPPPLWRPLALRSDVHLVSLQYGAAAGDLAAFGESLDWDHGIEPLADLDGFAALVAAMDSVVTPPNNTAHFAGSLDVPCRVLLPEDPDWRWELGTDASRWYPRTRLYRQTPQTGWAGLLERVAGEP